MNKEISLTNSNYFEIGIGTRVLEEQCYESKGDLPIYSANVFEPMGFLTELEYDALSKKKKMDYEHDYILWGIDGEFEFNMMKKGTKFGPTDHCGIIKILNQDIVPEYVLYQLDLRKRIMGHDRSYRPSLTNMEEVVVKIPFTKDDEIDTEKQKEIVSKFNLVQDMKNQIEFQLSELENSEVDLSDNSSNVVVVPISKICELPASTVGITEKFCNENKGDIPVYGSSKSEEDVVGYIKDNLKGVKYYENCLSWSRTGSVGHFFYRKGRFVPNENHKTLVIKEEYADKIIPEFLRYLLQVTIKKLGYDYGYILGKKKLEENSVELPVTEKGEIDVAKQQEIANRYEKVNKIKKEIINDLQTTNEVMVSL